MTIIKEDGSIVSGANSYITVAEYEAWIDARDLTHAGHGNVAKVEGHILRAMDWLETQSFVGLKRTKAQSLQWPRDGVMIDGFAVDSTEIPQDLINALYEATYADEREYGEMAVIDRQTKREKVGDLEVEYMDNANSLAHSPGIYFWLRKITVSQNMVVRV